MDADAPNIRVMALHALLYCERLFYLEEVEEIRVADAAVWAGRRLHHTLGEENEVVELVLESDRLGIKGRIDAVRTRDGRLHVIEHKRGRAREGHDGAGHEAWESDRIQAVAYAMLLEEHTVLPVREARVRYHASNVSVRVVADEVARDDVRRAVLRARELRASTDRPPVTKDENRCVRCSLAPVCLPEETRARRRDRPRTTRLFPADSERRTLHVVTPGARVGRSDQRLVVRDRSETINEVPIREVSDIVLHGMPQISTQALRLCADEGVPVHFVTASGTLLGTFTSASLNVQRKIRQYRTLAARDSPYVFQLARRLVTAKMEMQLRQTMRASRKEESLRSSVKAAIESMRACIRGASKAQTRGELLGWEGRAARSYFEAIALVVHPRAGPEMVPKGRSRRPPLDRFNALLSAGYGLLYRDVVSAVSRVGLEPALGLLHQPNSSALPLALDVMELFRVSIVDIAVLGAVNRCTFDPIEDFLIAPSQVWLSKSGRMKLIEVYERRKHQEYRHPALGYSLSFARMIELEVRLLEKEWSGEPGLFAQLRLR